jgi:hypothetical protein
MKGAFMTHQPDTMTPIEGDLKSICQLDRLWRGMLQSEKLQNEAAYRMAKLLHRLEVIADKFFIKTVKAQDMLAECMRLSQRLAPHPGFQDEGFYLLLTEIEQRVDQLVQKAHEFRIKAG